MPISVTAIFSKRNPAGQPCERFCPPSVLHTSSYLHVNLFVRSETGLKKTLSSEHLGESGKSHNFQVFSTMYYIWFYGFTWQKENHSILNQPSASDWGQVFFFSQICAKLLENLLLQGVKWTNPARKRNADWTTVSSVALNNRLETVLSCVWVEEIKSFKFSCLLSFEFIFFIDVLTFRTGGCLDYIVSKTVSCWCRLIFNCNLYNPSN